MNIKDVYNDFGQKKVPGRDADGRFVWYSTCYECGKEVQTTLRMKNKSDCDRCEHGILGQEKRSRGS